MKKKLLIICSSLAIAVASASVGATWYFASQATKAVSGAVTVEKYTNTGTVDATGTPTMTLGQGSGTGAITDLTKGINFSWGGLTGDYYINADSKTGDIGESSLTITRTYSVALDTALGTYVEIKSGQTGSWSDRTAISNSITFAYKTGKKPQNLTEYTAMLTALKSDAVGSTTEDVPVGNHVTITLSAAVADKTA